MWYKNDAGFSLPELLTTQVLAGIIASAALALLVFAQKTNQNAINTAGMTDQLQQIRQTLASGDECSLNFAGTALSMPNPTGAQVNKVQMIDPTGSVPTQTIAWIGQKNLGNLLAPCAASPLRRGDRPWEWRS